MKLYLMKGETTLMTEHEFHERVALWREKQTKQLHRVSGSLNLIKKRYIDEGTVERQSSIWGEQYIFRGQSNCKIEANATNWPFQISDYPDKIVITAESESNARERLSNKFAQYQDEIERNILKIHQKVPEHQELDFDLTKAMSEPFSNLNELEETVKGVHTMTDFETYASEALKLYTNRILQRFAEDIRAHGGVINDHNAKREKVDGLIITARMETCPVIQGTAVCTNPVYINNCVGLPHWSVVSCAGPYFAWHNNETLEHAVTRTNRALVKSENTTCPPIISFIEINYEEEENRG